MLSQVSSQHLCKILLALVIMMCLNSRTTSVPLNYVRYVSPKVSCKRISSAVVRPSKTTWLPSSRHLVIDFQAIALSDTFKCLLDLKRMVRQRVFKADLSQD